MVCHSINYVSRQPTPFFINKIIKTIPKINKSIGILFPAKKIAKKWKTITNITIEPDSFLIIWCDNDDEQGDNHTNFKLSGNGEFIGLINPDGETIIDSLTFAEQIADISYGRYPDGSEIWQLMNPTPGITNTQELRSNVNLIIPSQYTVYQNYPNPFNPVTTLRYDLPENGLVNITIYDMLGREVKTLINQTQDAGYRSIIWDATNDYGKPVSAGIYLYQIQAGEYMQTKKMVLLK